MLEIKLSKHDLQILIVLQDLETLVYLNTTYSMRIKVRVDSTDTFN